MSKRNNNTTNTSISAANTNTQDKWYSKFVKSNTTKGSHHQKHSDKKPDKKVNSFHDNPQENQKKSTSIPPKWTTYPQAIPSKTPRFSTSYAHIINKSALFDTQAVPEDAKHILDTFDSIVQEVQSLNSKQIAQLPNEIKALSHELTDTRSQRRIGYMNETVRLSAYIRYFMWWNLVRLVRLFSNIPTEQLLSDTNSNLAEIICLDIGSGPLTVPIALWLSHPDLRNKPIVWYCMDVSQTATSIGEELYLSIAAKTLSQPNDVPWKIIRVKGAMGTSIRKKAHLVTCANMMNEVQQHSDMPPEYQAKKYSASLQSYAETTGHILIVEPGVPDYARLISLIRDCFIRDGLYSVSPCVHTKTCPMAGRTFKHQNAKWCNFAFNTDDAPRALKALSAAAGIPKQRVVLSYLLVSPVQHTHDKTQLALRIASDPIRLPGNRTGFYACSELGLILVIDEKNKPYHLQSGDRVSIAYPVVKNLYTDPKTGALVITL
ncbi:MAG: hypothetical protein K6E51_05275 [Treponema sp.]|nr:hypothetical protein [Treponema sp.]